MSTLEIETEIKNAVQATDAVEIIDCGRVSERTQGFAWLIVFEGSYPPFNTLLL